MPQEGYCTGTGGAADGSGVQVWPNAGLGGKFGFRVYNYRV